MNELTNKPGGLAVLDQAELAALRTMTEAVRDGLSVEGVVTHCLERTLAHLGLDFGCVYVRRHDYLICLAAHGVTLALPGSAASDDELGAEPLDEAEPSGTLRPIVDVDEAVWAARPFTAYQTTPGGHRAWMALPLHIGDTWIGVLVMGGHGVTPEQLPTMPMAQRLVDPIAVAVDNAQRQAVARDILNDTRDIIFRTDERGRLTYLNTAWQETFGQPIPVALGQRLATYVGPDHRERLGDGLDALVPRGSVIGRQTLPFIVRQGKVRWMDVQARLVFDDRREVTGAAGVLRDVSRTVLQAKELQRANVDLKRHAAELEEANRELAAADQAKSEFLASVSHELQTPLAVILGYAEMLQDGMPDEPTSGQREFLEYIQESGQRLQRRIGDVMRLARLEAGRITVAAEPVTLVSAWRAALGRHQDDFEARRLCVSWVGDEDLLVLADPQRLGEVLDVLLDNAAKFGVEGGWVRVGARFSRRDPHLVQLFVEDNGVGVAPERLGNLFQRFVQADGSATRQHGGLGLGLAIARGLCERMGGSLELHSAGEGQGATAVVSLPAVTP